MASIPMIEAEVNPAADAGKARASAVSLAQLRDALGRGQPELPLALFADTDLPLLFRLARRAQGVSTQHVEEALVRQHRSSLQGSAAFKAALWIDGGPLDVTAFDGVLGDGSSTRALVAIDRVRDAGREASARLGRAHPGAWCIAIHADAALELPIPRGLPRPALFILPGDALGSRGTVEAVRLLRMVRSSMRAGDRLLVGVDLHTDPQALLAAWGDPRGPLAAWHGELLRTLQLRFGAEIDPGALAFQVRHDRGNLRTETHLVATRKTRVAIPGLEVLVLGRGESIRTSVHSAGDRRRLTGALAGCAMTIVHWVEDETRRVAVALTEAAS